MRRNHTAALLGFAGGFAVMLTLGLAAQPEDQPADEPTVEERLDRIERGLFKHDSKFPLDDSQSIERMLEVIRSLVAQQVVGGDRAAPGPIDDDRLRLLDREVAELTLSVQNLDRGKVAQLRRDLDQLEREASSGRTVDDVRREIDRVQSELRSLDRRVGSLERKIR